MVTRNAPIAPRHGRTRPGSTPAAASHAPRLAPRIVRDDGGCPGPSPPRSGMEARAAARGERGAPRAPRLQGLRASTTRSPTSTTRSRSPARRRGARPRSSASSSRPGAGSGCCCCSTPTSGSRTLHRHYLVGQFVGNVLPSTIGGDVVRVARASKNGRLHRGVVRLGRARAAHRDSSRSRCSCSWASSLRPSLLDARARVDRARHRGVDARACSR